MMMILNEAVGENVLDFAVGVKIFRISRRIYSECFGALDEDIQIVCKIVVQTR